MPLQKAPRRRQATTYLAKILLFIFPHRKVTPAGQVYRLSPFDDSATPKATTNLAPAASGTYQALYKAPRRRQATTNLPTNLILPHFFPERMTPMRDTIAAIATATGGGVGMVRLSGPQALAVAGRVFRPMNPAKSPETMPGYTGAFGRVCHGEQLLDEAVLFVYHAPHSYTGEDVAEFCCHGGEFVLSQVLAAVIAAGARPAEAGEYTRRALMNGRMTLTEAESVIDILAAQNTQSLRAALGAMEGALHREVLAAADTLTDCCAHISAWIDYPEEDVEEVSPPVLLAQLNQVEATLARLEQSWQQGQMVRQGIATAIIGSANVGKSTLMNLLSGRERSIVTAIPGTTRDVIEETVRLGDLTLRLSDTAGLRQSDDPVEQIGVERSRRALEQCDLILAVFDESRPLTPEECEWLPQLLGRAAVVIYNKQDLPPALTAEEKAAIAAVAPASVSISAAAGTGLAELTEAIRQVVGLSHFDPTAAIIANARQLECITAARRSLREGIEAISAGETLDAVSVCLEQAADALLTLTGRRASAEAIDKVFEQFCVGK